MKSKDVDFLYDIMISLMTAELDRDWALAELKAKTKTEKEQTNESAEK